MTISTYHTNRSVDKTFVGEVFQKSGPRLSAKPARVISTYETTHHHPERTEVIV